MLKAFNMIRSGIFTALLVLTGFVLNGQDLNKEVFVVRPYEPTLSDASKYNFMPPENTMETSIPAFQYSIAPKRLSSSFVPDPIKAARTVTTSLPKIYNTWLKAGLGNYSTPLFEFNISNVRSKDYAYGAYIHHKSSRGKVLLKNDRSVNAGYVDNLVKLYGKRFFSNVTLSGGLNFEQHAFNYYGYNTDTLAGPVELRKDTFKQRVIKPGAEIGLKSSFAPDRFNFDLNARFDYFADRLKNKEPDFLISTRFTKEVSGLLGGLDISLDYSRLTNNMDTTAVKTNNTIFRFSPWISKSSDDWQFRLGFEGAADMGGISRFYFYPRADLNIIIVKDVLIPFIGVSGELKKNSYQNLFEENMFIQPGLALKNTSSNFIAFGGVKGNISSVVRFRADASITIFKDYHFFVNDTVTPVNLLPLDNKFTGEYDDMNLITYHGQLVFSPGNKFELMADGKIFNYKIFDVKKPWHEPDFEIKTQAVYRYDKFEIGAGVDVIGNRWVKVRKTINPEGMEKIKPVFDGNLSLNFHYSKLLTVFADFYNLAERSYTLWNQYPSQRFNFLVGFSYKL
jgi:hypothetical protein